MADSRVPDPDADVVQNIMTRADMRKTVVKVIFTPKRAKLDPVRPRRWEFATSVLATEFIQSICPSVGAQLGSPKQARAKIARLLRLADPSIVTNYTITTEVTIGADRNEGVEAPNDESLVADVDTFETVTVDDDTSVEPLDVLAALEVETETFEFPE